MDNKAYSEYSKEELIDAMLAQSRSDFMAGQTVAYIPNHKMGEISGEEIEFGIIKKINDFHIYVAFYKDILSRGSDAVGKSCEPHNLLSLEQIRTHKRAIV